MSGASEQANGPVLYASISYSLGSLWGGGGGKEGKTGGDPDKADVREPRKMRKTDTSGKIELKEKELER